MRTSRTPKIVIGVGLLAVYAVILSTVILRDERTVVAAPHEQDSIQAAATGTYDATVPAALVADSASPSGAATTTAEQPATTNPEQPVAVAAQSRAPAPARAAATPAEDKAIARAMPVPSQPTVVQNVASAVTTNSPDVSADTSEAAMASVAPEVAAAPSPAAQPAPSDSQITADVRSEVAAVAPDDSIEVTTRDGVVALAGSVSSQDVINKAWLAARNVAAVKDVDVSALMVGN
jgi:osmotically-inducible protein OsmY